MSYSVIIITIIIVMFINKVPAWIREVMRLSSEQEDLELFSQLSTTQA